MSLGSACLSRKARNAIIQAEEFCLKGIQGSGVLGCCGRRSGIATVSNRTTQQARWCAMSDWHWAGPTEQVSTRVWRRKSWPFPSLQVPGNCTESPSSVKGEAQRLNCFSQDLTIHSGSRDLSGRGTYAFLEQLRCKYVLYLGIIYSATEITHHNTPPRVCPGCLHGFLQPCLLTGSQEFSSSTEVLAHPLQPQRAVPWRLRDPPQGSRGLCLVWFPPV